MAEGRNTWLRAGAVLKTCLELHSALVPKDLNLQSEILFVFGLYMDALVFMLSFSTALGHFIFTYMHTYIHTYLYSAKNRENESEILRPKTQTFSLRPKVWSKGKGKGSPYSITEHRVSLLIPVLGSQPAGDVSHKPGGRLPLLSARPAVTLATLKRAATNFAAW